MVHEKQCYRKSTEHYNHITKSSFEFYRLVTDFGISIPSHHSNKTQENSSAALFSSKHSFQDLIATVNSERLTRLHDIDALPTLISGTRNSYHKIDLNIYKVVDAAAST